MRLNLARGLIGLVLLVNLQCAALFLLNPQGFAPAFELIGAAGTAALQGIGVLFLMWNIPYLVALWHPARHRISLWEAVVMQSIGLVGESLIYISSPAGLEVLRSSLARFIAFDAAGLICLIVAVWLVRPITPAGGEQHGEGEAV